MRCPPPTPLALLLALLLAGVLGGCGAADPPGAEPRTGPVSLVVAGVELDAEELRRIAQLSPLPDVPLDPTNRVADDPRAARLGHWLFFDPSLSKDGTVSCATCHVPSNGFADERSISIGLELGTRHAPSLLNAAHHRWQGWGGKADSLWAQALGPLEHPLEMGGDRVAIARTVAEDAELRDAYEGLFGRLPALEDASRFPAHARPLPEGVEDALAVAWLEMRAEDRDAVDRVFANLGKALAAYERLLVRRDAPFDRLAAELARGRTELPEGVSAAAVRGLELFLGRAGCVMCHSGPHFSDGEFHNTGAPLLGGGEGEDPARYQGQALVVGDPFNAAGPHSDERDGVAARRAAGARTATRGLGQFKTPSLRNVLSRRPLMHQGQFATLEDVLHFYDTLEGFIGRSHHQEQILTPLGLTPGERSDLLAFLAALEGAPLPATLLERPLSPLVRD